MTIAILAGCSDDPTGPTPPPPPPDPGVVKVTVKSSTDSIPVANSNVVLYNAETNEPLKRGFTDVNGTVSFTANQGDYYLNLSAQGFDPVPVENIAPIPFYVPWEVTTSRDVFLDVVESGGSSGFVMGHVTPATSGVLILAKSQTTQDKYYTASGPDGFFVLYNLPFDTYDMDALKAGIRMTSPVSAMISAPADVDTVDVPVATYTGSTLHGSVTFLASENSTVDITLLDPDTRAVIPGLTVMSNPTGLTYEITGIPDGDFIAWASLRNEGYVIDPDWLFKNPGGLDISFAGIEDLELNFGVTGAITLVSPTNPADETIPAMADSAVPTFTWLPYPSTKEYFIEVRDFNGNVLWGGINADGTVNHAFIGAAVNEVTYNFDNQPGAPDLQPGEVYQWRLWADKGTASDSFVEQLISASEDLLGVFEVPASAP